MAVEFRILGPLEIRRDGVPMQPRGRKQATLLGVLLLEHGRVVSADQLIEALWPSGPPAGARHALEMHVSRLRALLGDDALLAGRAPGYVLDIDPQSLDAVRFEQLAVEAQDALEHDPARAAAQAADALVLWRGEPLVDFAYDSFAQGEIGRLDELRRRVEETRAEAELALGRAPELIGELEALVADAPLRERRRALLMRALYAAGRQADALATYRDARTLLQEELGLEPGEELRALERAILQQDASLASGAPPASTGVRERRHVTVVAVEPEISLEVDPEEHQALADEAAAVVAHVAEQFGAHRLDEFVLVFAHEDHAERAHAAAAALAEALPARIGAESGEALVADGGIRGPVVERARRRALLGEWHADVPAPLRRFDGPFVDRVDELAALKEGTAVLVVGPAGIGKTRLLRELARTEQVHVGRCSSYGADAIAPLRELAASLGVPDALDGVTAAEVPLTLRRLCERTPGIVVALDDVQWGGEIVLETVAHFVEHGVRIVCLARDDDVLAQEPALLPELERLVLEPLSSADAARLAAELGGDDDALVVRAEGNPLFIEQLLAHSSEAGDALPATLSSLVAARLDRLSPLERRIVQHAAVIGRDFDNGLLGELLDTGSPRRALAALVRRGLLEDVPAEAAFEERLRFRHPLIRETAYETTPKAERSHIHERLSGLLAARSAGDELVGFHLERAASLAVRDESRRVRLAEAGGRRLGAAGIGAFKLGYAAHAADLFARAASLLPAADAQRRELLCELGVAATAAGERGHAQAALAEARSAAIAAGDERIQLRSETELAVLRQLERAPDAARILVERVEEGLPVFERAADDRSLGRALLLRGWMEGGVFGRCRAWEEAAERALAHYRRIGFPSSTCVTQIASALYYGATPVASALRRLERLRAEEVDDLVGEASVLAHSGALHAMAGDHDAAADELARSRAIYEELARPEALLLTCEPLEAESVVLAGDLERAAAIVRRNCETLRERGLWLPYATRAAFLAEVLLDLGRAAESEQWAAEAEHRAVAEDAWSQIAWRAARARRTGETDLAHDALARARATDLVGLEARALLAVGDAASVLEATRVYEAKGNVVAAARAAATTRFPIR